MASAPTRRSAEERRREIVEIAIRHFAQNGYNGTSTDQVAREAGISQPYLFRLFGTKRDLFLACVDVNHERIEATFRRAAGGGPRDEALARMGDAYVDQLRDSSGLLFQMQSYAACADPAIQEHVREGFATLVRQVHEATGASPADLFSFFSHGMLLNVIAALQLEALGPGEEWATCWLDPDALLSDPD